MDLCLHKLNNSLISYEKDRELFLKYVAWHNFATGGLCRKVWTPFSDEHSEGMFLNMNNYSKVPVKKVGIYHDKVNRCLASYSLRANQPTEHQMNQQGLYVPKKANFWQNLAVFGPKNPNFLLGEAKVLVPI